MHRVRRMNEEDQPVRRVTDPLDGFDPPKIDGAVSVVAPLPRTETIELEISAIDVIIGRAHVKHPRVKCDIAVDVTRCGAGAAPYGRSPGDLAIHGEIGNRLRVTDVRSRVFEPFADLRFQRWMNRANGIAEDIDDVAEEFSRCVERGQLSPWTSVPSDGRARASQMVLYPPRVPTSRMRFALWIRASR